MPRDSLFSERIVWSGGPAAIVAPSLYRAAAWLLIAISAVSTLLTIAAARAVQFAPAELMVFAAWCATFALLLHKVPVIWAQSARFTVTDDHVIWSRGRYKRSIQRNAISYARINWNHGNPGAGDLELVRAVPTGVFQRGLTLVFRGVSAPDRVWSIVRGVPTTAAGGNGRRPLAQRLDEDERVIWSGKPVSSWLAWLPLSARRALTALFAVSCLAVAVRTLVVAIPVVRGLVRAGVPALSVAFLALAGAFALTVALLASLSSGLFYVGLIRKPLRDRKTHYLVTNKRVLIQRDDHEIHLDRRNVVDVIDEKGRYGGRDVYFVMDGPQSRALAASGAFGPGENAKGFLPVLRGITDVEELKRAMLPHPRTPIRARTPMADAA